LFSIYMFCGRHWNFSQPRGVDDLMSVAPRGNSKGLGPHTALGYASIKHVRSDAQHQSQTASITAGGVL
jgi:hypothetical protein